MTVPFMCNFPSLSNKFPTIFGSLIFHTSLPRLGYFSQKSKPKIFGFKNVMERGIRKFLLSLNVKLDLKISEK